MFKRLEREAETIIKSVVQLVYYMKGSIQYDDMMFRTPGERDIINDFLTKIAEAEAKAVKGK